MVPTNYIIPIRLEEPSKTKISQLQVLHYIITLRAFQIGICRTRINASNILSFASTLRDTLKETPSAITKSTNGTRPSIIACKLSNNEGEWWDLSPSPSTKEGEDDRTPAAAASFVSPSSDHRGRKIKGILKKESPPHQRNLQDIQDFEATIERDCSLAGTVIALCS